ncbi:MAG TPA: GSU2403 family nucleotidyltransferase fold protein [Pyrinomonadaceae bacterium]|nr:GSU2403 family nucleotidyltransferase fold protein [Pyrinomonadaceae bacterium]
MEDSANFARLVEAIRSWLPHIVIVGGWAHRLHRFHPLATVQDYQPLRTVDVDLAFSPRAPLRGDLKQALKNADFDEELFGDVTPPVAHYALRDASFYAEFLTVLQGDGLRRDGQRDLTLAKAGITAQKLRYLDVLLIAPWSITLGPDTGIPIKQTNVLVPNPVSFLVQKLLIHSKRPANKKAQDILYIHDSLQLFGASLDTLTSVWRDEIRPKMPVRTAKTVLTIAKELFGEVTDVTRDAARIPADRVLQPDDIRAASQYGFAKLFDTALGQSQLGTQ